MRFFQHHLPDVILVIFGIVAQYFAIRQLRPPRWLATFIMTAGPGLLVSGLLLRSYRIQTSLPLALSTWLGSLSFLILLLSVGGAVAIAAWAWVPRPQPQHSPERRNFLFATRTAMLAAPVVATGYGVFVQRSNFRLREVNIPIPGLAKELDGLRLVQLSDIHLSPFLSERELARTVDMANETGADLALVTGDIITSYHDPLDAGIKQLGRLRAQGGVIGCHGNHEVYAKVENYATEEGARAGIRFLRNEAQRMTFRGSPINFVGVDYQPMHEPYLRGAGKHVVPGMPNILLSHNPDVFPVAAAQGYHLTLAGHTHGGQITFEILHQNVSVARFYTPYVYGLYQEKGASVYVTRGIGTVGIPARLGAPPEVALIRLCAT